MELLQTGIGLKPFEILNNWKYNLFVTEDFSTLLFLDYNRIFAIYYEHIFTHYRFSNTIVY